MATADVVAFEDVVAGMEVGSAVGLMLYTAGMAETCAEG